MDQLNLGVLGQYIWDRLPIILVFADGFMIYRLLTESDLTGRLVARAMFGGGARPQRIVLATLVTAAVLSMFISNTVTALLLLPFLKTAVGKVAPPARRVFTSSLTMAAVYGANLGGVGSLIGSPANLLLIGALDAGRVPAAARITFLNWWYWSLPLLFMLLALAVVVLHLGQPRSFYEEVGADLPSGPAEPATVPAGQRTAGRWFLLFLLFLMADGVLAGLVRDYRWLQSAVHLVVFLMLIGLLFFPIPGRRCEPLLHWRNLIGQLPRRGLLFMGLFLGIYGLTVLALPPELEQYLTSAISSWDMGPPGRTVGLVLGVIFLTEILSNVLVVGLFFPVAQAMAAAQGLGPLPFMVMVSVAANCAFMLPVATSCNALLYGEMQGLSLRRFLAAGLVMNIGAGLIIAAWLPVALPWIYRLD
ncbi:MAG: hypothetical protein JXQ27_09850 [Acidobacteria bacterium]|nr:hypothetical protein [Acidobacteriota bacterium]